VRPVRTDTTTAVLGAPRDWDASVHGECEGLPIAVNDNVMFSYWRPSPVEVLRILRGKPIRLGVFGTGHPPVSIDTEE
jgi:hypothetical protein